MITGAVALLAVAFFSLKDQIVTSADSSNSGNIKMTEVQVNLNCPVDPSVITNLMEVYVDNSCPRITIKRLDLKNNNQISIEPSFSWLTTFKSSFFPLVKEDLEEDMNGFRNIALTQDVQRLLNTPQGGNADCFYNAVQANCTFRSTQMNSNNLTAYVNKEVAQGKNKVVFKVLKCTPAPQASDRDRDGFVDARDKCPDTPGRYRGCPDSDSDGFADDIDNCKNKPGNCDGCFNKINLKVKYDYSSGIISWENYNRVFQSYNITVISVRGSNKIVKRNINGNSCFLDGVCARIWNPFGPYIISLTGNETAGNSIPPICLMGSSVQVQKLKCDS